MPLSEPSNIGSVVMSTRRSPSQTSRASRMSLRYSAPVRAVIVASLCRARERTYTEYMNTVKQPGRAAPGVVDCASISARGAATRPTDAGLAWRRQVRSSAQRTGIAPLPERGRDDLARARGGALCEYVQIVGRANDSGGPATPRGFHADSRQEQAAVRDRRQYADGPIDAALLAAHRRRQRVRRDHKGQAGAAHGRRPCAVSRSFRHLGPRRPALQPSPRRHVLWLRRGMRPALQLSRLAL